VAGPRHVAQPVMALVTTYVHAARHILSRTTFSVKANCCETRICEAQRHGVLVLMIGVCYLANTREKWPNRNPV